jgi:hypothetical protein
MKKRLRKRPDANYGARSVLSGSTGLIINAGKRAPATEFSAHPKAQQLLLATMGGYLLS